MSIHIEKRKCTGCGKCMSVCPGTLLQKDEQGHVEMPFPGDCWSCAACVKACSFGVLSLYLFPSIGGKGCTMTVQKKGTTMRWNIKNSEGALQTITVNSNDANKY